MAILGITMLVMLAVTVPGAQDPGQLRRSRRAALGLAEHRDWVAARRAVARGTAGPTLLRTSIRELAADRIAQLDRPFGRSLLGWVLRLAFMTGAWCVAFFLEHGNLGGGLTVVFFAGLATSTSPGMRRHQQARAARALIANA